MAQTTPNLPGDPAPGADPLAALYRMSDTAGATGNEYVAVNVAAVFCALLGLASGLSLLSTLFLFLPALAVLCGILAWRQVVRSNGTQTGKLLIAGGLLLAIGFGGFSITAEALESARVKHDSARMAELIQQMAADMRASRYADAYALFSPEFQERVSFQQFSQWLDQLQSSTMTGRIQAAQWNGVRPFYPGDVTTRATICVYITFDQGKEQFLVEFRKSGQDWRIDNVEKWFPQPNLPRTPKSQPPGGA